MTSSTLAGLFGKSPIKPLQAHMNTVTHCAQLVRPFVEAVIEDNWQRAEELYNEIAESENDGDNKKKQIRQHLHKSLFLPIPREDLLSLLSKQDKIANTSKDIAGLMLGRKMSVPAELSTLIIPYIQSAIDSTLAAQDMINELDELIETGFSGRQIDFIEKIITRLESLESENDTQQIEIRSNLHPLEKNLPPVDAMFMYSIIDLIGNLADRAETVGDQLQVIVAK